MENTPPQFDLDELDQLLAQAEVDGLNEKERSRLNSILRASPEAISHTSEKMIIEALLRSELVSDATGNLLGSEAHLLPTYLEEKVIPLPSQRKRNLLAIAAAVLFFSILGAMFMRSPDPQQVEATPPPAPIAKLVNDLDSRFAPQSSPNKGEFELGHYELEAGIAELEFRTGAKFVVEGPAQFTIKNDMHVFLNEGNIRARVPETASGFRIDAPEVGVIDLGTEFGIAVDSQKKTEVHVFSGEVELQEDFSKGSRLVREGYAAGWENGNPAVVLNTPNEDKFRAPKDITKSLGKQLFARLMEDEALVVYYDFQPNEASTNSLVNRANPGKIDGIVTGATWGQGRQSDSGALLFENLNDRVALNVPGEFPEFTLSTWVKVERFDSYITTIFNSDSYERQEHHWQILDDGGIRASQLGINFSGSSPETYRVTSVENTVPIGSWTHLAATFSIKEGRARYYANGSLVSEIAIDTSATVRLGRSHIGHWGSPPAKSWPKQRDFRGRIDEFLLFKRAMSSSEINELYEIGKPAKW